MKKIVLTMVAFFLATLFIQSQNVYEADYESHDTANYPYWIEMMQDQNINVFKTVDAFNRYWKNRPDRKGQGYNPFKRWEWYIKHKMRPDGSRLPVDYDKKMYEKYFNSHRSNDEFTGDWENIGPIHLPDSPNPYWGNGRINAIAFHPSDPDIFYIGAPSGGLWKTEDGGQSWEPLTDGQPSLGVSSIVVNYDNPNEIYLGTGDRDHGDAAALGIYKSDDGGETWTAQNDVMGNVVVGRLIQHPNFPETLFAATSGGVYKTTNGGETWSRKTNSNSKDILFKPDDPTKMYSVSGSRFYRSNDSGETWQQITSGLPSGGARAVIGVSPDNPDYVYMFVTTSAEFYGLYKSIDAGLSFIEQSNSPNIMGWSCNGGSGGQAWYDLDMAVDPLNAETIFAGGINCWKSTDGGVNWVMSSNQVGDCGGYPVHADLHVLEYNPVNGKLYVGNDGGIWWTNDGGSSWNRITDGLAIGQQYKLGQSKIISNHVTTGYQDNGISIFHTDEWIQSDMYADGMECSMDISDTTLGYGCMQYGRMYRMVNDKAIKLIAGQDIGGITEQGNWITPFCQHESNPDIMFAGYQNLWRTTNLLASSPSWEKISDGTGTIAVVEHSPADENLFYLATASGFYRSDDIMEDSPQFTSLSSALPSSGSVFDIDAHPWNPDIVYIVQNQKVFKSLDKGLNWQDISGTLPAVNMNDIAYYDRAGIEGLYVGSNVGVFFKDETMDDWVNFSEGLPAALLVTEVEIYHDQLDPAKDRIRISSFGRGLWGSIPYHYHPVADFTSSETLIPTGCAVDFYDRSSGYPQSWSWTFEGATPSSSNDANPHGIVYDQVGTYEVSLTVTNSEGSDSKTVTGYITVSDDQLPIVDFTANDTIQCSGSTIHFYDLSKACPVAWEWSFDPGNISFTEGTDQYSENPVVEFADIGPYSVTLKVTNNTGENQLTKEDFISIGGNYIPFYEDFQNGTFVSKGWQVNNPDGKKTWELITFADENQVAWMNFFSYTSLGERDYLNSPLLNFQGFESVFLTFKYAYAQRYNQKDSLIVNVSDNCGETWTRVYAGGPDGEGHFATSPPNVQSFIPLNNDDWCGAGYGASCPIVDLSDWAGEANIMVQFESYANYGNNLYLTDIDVSNTIGVDERSAKIAEPFIFFPNPATGEVTVYNLTEKPGTLHLMDLQGRLLSELHLDEEQVKLNLSHLYSGVYLIRFRNQEYLKTKKLIIN